MISIRAFLSGVLLATFLLFNFIAVLSGYNSSVEAMQNVLDEHLSNTAKLMVHTYNKQPTDGLNYQNFEYQIIQSSQVLEHSPGIVKKIPVPLKSGFHWANFNEARWRVFVFYSNLHDIWVVVAEPKSQRDGVAEEAALSAVTPILFGLPLAVVVIWGVITVALKPLAVLSQKILQKSEDDLSPVVMSDLPKELQPLIENTNALLARLSNAFDKEKHFIAEASHELRTPISTLKIHLHNLADQLSSSDDYQVLKAQVDNLARLVDQLLDLSKSQSGQYKTAFQTLNLRTVAEEECANLYPLIDQKHLNIELDADDLELKVHPLGIKTVFSNLIGNAIKYTPEGGQIYVSVKRQNHHVEIKVVDSGPGIDASKHNILERFYRAESSSEPIQGAGLGLAIVNAIVQQHGANIEFNRSDELGGLQVLVKFEV